MDHVTRKIIVTGNDESGRCNKFQDLQSGKIMDIAELVTAIENGEFKNCAVGNFNNIQTEEKL